MSEDDTVEYEIEIDDEEYAFLEQEAGALGLTVSEYASKIVREYLESLIAENKEPENDS